MKKRLLGLLMLIGLSQAQAQKGIEIGFSIQPQLTWLLNRQDMNSGYLVEYERNLAGAFGLNLGYNFSDNIGIRSGLIYSIQGQKYHGSYSVASYSESQRLDYFKVPLLFKYNTNPNKKAIFILNAGPELGVLAKSIRTIDYTFYDGTIVNYKNNDTEPFSTIDIAASLGVGCQFNLSAIANVRVMLCSAYSFTDAENKAATSNGGPYYNTSRTSNNNATVGLNLSLNYIL